MPAGFLDFKPTVDGAQIPNNVIPLLEAGKMHDVPIMIGTNTNEGATFIYGAVAVAVAARCEPERRRGSRC